MGVSEVMREREARFLASVATENALPLVSSGLVVSISLKQKMEMWKTYRGFDFGLIRSPDR